MNRTQRAMLRSTKKAMESDRRQKNKDIAQHRELIRYSKGDRGIDKINHCRDINHLSKCIRRDENLLKDGRNDIIIYKKRFADAKKSVKEIIVA